MCPGVNPLGFTLERWVWWELSPEEGEFGQEREGDRVGTSRDLAGTRWGRAGLGPCSGVSPQISLGLGGSHHASSPRDLCPFVPLPATPGCRWEVAGSGEVTSHGSFPRHCRARILSTPDAGAARAGWHLLRVGHTSLSFCFLTELGMPAGLGAGDHLVSPGIRAGRREQRSQRCWTALVGVTLGADIPAGIHIPPGINTPRPRLCGASPRFIPPFPTLGAAPGLSRGSSCRTCPPGWAGSAFPGLLGTGLGVCPESSGTLPGSG